MPVDYSKITKFVTPIQIQRQLSGIWSFLFFTFCVLLMSQFHRWKDKCTQIILQTDISTQYSGPTQKTFIRIKLIKSLLKQIC